MSQEQPPPQGLTAEVMAKLEGGKRVESRGRVTNTFTYVLAGLAVLVGTFSAGAWVGRDNAPEAAASTGTAGAGSSSATGSGGFAGRNGSAGFTGASGFTGAPGGAAGVGGTTGTVKLVDGTNVYITTPQGTTIKVTTNAQSTVTVTKQGGVADLAVGETVVVQGEAGADGTIAATAIRSGLTGFGGNGQRGGGAGTAGANAGVATASGATGTPATGR